MALTQILARKPDVDLVRIRTTIKKHMQEEGSDPREDVTDEEIVSPAVIRKRLGMSQRRFADVIRVPVATLQNWEQGRTLMDPSARALMIILAREPRAALRALGQPAASGSAMRATGTDIGKDMPAALHTDPVLARFRQALDHMYGNRLGRAVLFGSRARGDARKDSDYDVAVFLKSLPDRWVELDRLAHLRVEMIDETGAFFDVMPYLDTALEERTPLMHEIRRDGVDL